MVLASNLCKLIKLSFYTYPPSLPFRGAVFAVTLSQIAAFLLLLAAMWAWGLHKLTWGGWSWECLVDWWTFTKLAIPGLFMLCMKWWSYEVGIVVVGMKDKKELAVYTITLNVIVFLFMVC